MPHPTYLDGLNPEQRCAVEHGVTSFGANIGVPLHVGGGPAREGEQQDAVGIGAVDDEVGYPMRQRVGLAGAGAGDHQQRPAEGIIAIALRPTRAPIPLSWSGTFHATAARLLRQYAGTVGLDPAFTIHDRGDSEDLINLIRHEHGLSAKERRFPMKGTCLAIYSRAANANEPLEAVLLKQFPWCAEWKTELGLLFDAYVEAKQKQGVLDYDDLLLYWHELMQVPDLAAIIAGHFDHVLVDEYQDTNALQAAILLALKPDGRGLTVVGDDAQAIYGFRAADVRNILDFPALFTPPASIITLEQNYRSTQPILAASNAVIGLAKERFTKNLRSSRLSDAKPSLVTVTDDVRQVDFVVESILRNREAGTTLKQQAVLFRSSHHSALLEIELARRNIPFVKFGGLKFVDAAHVKDMLAVLRWAENPGDRVTGFRVLQMLDGIGPATAGKALEHMIGRSLEDGLATFEPPSKAATQWRGLIALMSRLRDESIAWPAQFELVREWYQPHLEQHYDDAVLRAADLEQLQRIASMSPSRTQFLTELTLDPPNATTREGAPVHDDDYLILSTIHSAKGQEWTAVFVLNVVDGCIPSDRAAGKDEEIEEERRLLYVAMTRAKDQLTLIVPQRFYTRGRSPTGDQHHYFQRSRFIPLSVLDQFEVCSWPPATQIAHGAPMRPGLEVSLAARMRGRWGGKPNL